mgnify:CR=1 FL=1
MPQWGALGRFVTLCPSIVLKLYHNRDNAWLERAMPLVLAPSGTRILTQNTGKASFCVPILSPGEANTVGIVLSTNALTLYYKPDFLFYQYTILL